ncbi:hypothetical protein ES703_48348 [subsurface metagenome]
MVIRPLNCMSARRFYFGDDGDYQFTLKIVQLQFCQTRFGHIKGKHCTTVKRVGVILV